jgi:hypothetical protein
MSGCGIISVGMGVTSNTDVGVIGLFLVGVGVLVIVGKSLRDMHDATNTVSNIIRKSFKYLKNLGISFHT